MSSFPIQFAAPLWLLLLLLLPVWWVLARHRKPAGQLQHPDSAVDIEFVQQPSIQSIHREHPSRRRSNIQIVH